MMTQIFDFKKRFGEVFGLDEVKNDFVNKINYFLFNQGRIDEFIKRNPNIFVLVCLSMGENPSDVIDKYAESRSYVSSSGDDVEIPPLRHLTQDQFKNTLFMIEAIYQALPPKKTENEGWKDRINKALRISLVQPLSLGVVWRDGKFYPEGAEELNNKLIVDVLKWLESKPKVHKLYKNALDHYSQSLKDKIKRKDVFVNAFQAVEQMTKDFLESPKESFDNNFNLLIDKLELNTEWKKICNSYKELSKEFGRHSGKKEEFIPSKEETEAFLYLSGLLLRLIIEKKSG